MRYFSFKILILCILLPPVLYILTIQAGENYLQKTCTREIENHYLGDTRLLFDGSISLKDAVNANIDRYLKDSKLAAFGLVLKVTITTKTGKIIYPAIFSQGQDSLLPQESNAVAAENYILLNEGLRVDLDTRVEYLAPFPLLVLAFYIVLSIMVLYLHYRTVTRKLAAEEQEKQAKIERLIEQEKETSKRLEHFHREREKLTADLRQMKDELKGERSTASHNEDELIEEIESLEEKLQENLALQKEQQDEIALLEERMQLYEKNKRRDDKQRTGAARTVGKRFNTLYKNISINERAVSGFVDLNDDLKIKAEEVIHQLNEDSAQVVVKRKVFFGKRDKKSIMEVIFGYKGRLYFRKLKDGTTEVLAIGTKNTQAREMEFLNKL